MTTTARKKRWALALPFDRAVQAMQTAEQRDRVLVAFGRGAANYLDGVKGYAVSHDELYEIFSLSEQGLLMPQQTIKLPVPAVDEFAFTIQQGVAHFGAVSDVGRWQSLCAPAALGPHGIAILPATVDGQTVLLLAGPLAAPIDADLQRTMIKLSDVAGLALARTLLLQQQQAQYQAKPVSGAETLILPKRKRPPRARVAIDQLTADTKAPTTALSVELDLAFVELVISGNVSIPPYPGVATELTNLVGSGDFGLRDLGDLIKTDQALSAEVLRHANSSIHGGGVQVTSLDQAIARVGARSLVGLALSVKLGSTACSSGPLMGLKHQIWRQSVASAMLCERLAERRGLDTGEAFMCGLLHDFGSVIATACIEELLADEQKALPAESWEDVVQRYHVELGRVVSENWQLPESVNTAIIAHHRPELAGAHRKMTELVACSDQIVALLEEKAHLSQDVLARLDGLDKDDVLEIFYLIPQMPELLSEMLVHAAPSSSEQNDSSLMRDSESALEGPLTPIELPVVRITKTAESNYTTCHVAKHGLGMLGRDPLAMNGLVHLEIEGEQLGTIALWMRVVRCRRQDEQHLIELTPYALGAAAAKSWDGFCEAVQATRGLGPPPTSPPR
jgi:HD-like signal output (HDOD) protein